MSGRKDVKVMEVLLADANRDMLMCFKKIIEFDGHEVSTAFDGAQVVKMIANHHFDMVILNDNIPRVKCTEIIKHLNEGNIPVIVLTGEKINSKTLLAETLANSYLSFPFLPYELTELMNKVRDKAASNKLLKLSDVEIKVSDFRLCGQLRMTNEEIDILSSLVEQQNFNEKKAGTHINSLNNKFKKINKKLHIRYVMNEGYRLVTENE